MDSISLIQTIRDALNKGILIRTERNGDDPRNPRGPHFNLVSYWSGNSLEQFDITDAGINSMCYFIEHNSSVMKSTKSL